MSFEIITDFDYSAVNRSLAEFSRLSPRAADDAVRKAARGFTRRVVDITPPASAGRTGLAARRQGEKRIDHDLGDIFFPVVLRGKRPEQYPDVEALYNQQMAGRKGRRRTRQRQLYHVDAGKLEALRQKLYLRVGYLAGGWNAAADLLDVDLPAWIKRHGTEHGTCHVEITDDGILVTVSNMVEYSGDVDGYPRRVQYALDYEAAALERETEQLLIKAGSDAGFALV